MKRTVIRLTVATVVIMLAVGSAVRVSGGIDMGSLLRKIDITGGVTIKQDDVGRAYESYSGKKVPRSRKDEMSFSASQLILSSQERDDIPKTSNAAGHSDIAQLPASSRSQLASATETFLTSWETFSATTTLDSYKAQLRANGVDNNTIEVIAARDDSLTRTSASPQGTSGQQFLSETLDPNVHLTVIRYDGKTAYLAATGTVQYTGPDPTLVDTTERREYAVVLTRFPMGWKVTRVASQVT